MRSFALISIALAIGCGGSTAEAPQPADPKESSTSPPTPGDDDDAVASDGTKPKERLLALFDSLDKKIESRDESCKGFTETLTGWLQQYGDEIRDLLIMDLSDEAHEAIDESINDVATTVVFAASECGSSDAAVAAYDEFDALVL